MEKKYIILGGSLKSSPDLSGYLQRDGSVALTANWDAGSYKITAEQLQSDIATGTAPLIVASTTLVSNLNADLLDGNEASAFLKHDGTISMTDDLNMGNNDIRMGTGAVGFDGTAGEGFTFATNGSVTLGAGTNAQLILPAGSEAAPSIGWTDTGFYERAADNIGVSCGGSLTSYFQAAAFRSNLSASFYIQNIAGSSTDPVYAFNDDRGTGMGRAAADQLSLISGGKEMLRLVETGTATSDQLIIGPAGIIGSAATPSLAFGDGDTGFYESADDEIELSFSGATTFGLKFSNLGIEGFGGSRFKIVGNANSSDTVPTLIPSKLSSNTGIGMAAVGQLSCITIGRETMRMISAADTDSDTNDVLATGVSGYHGLVLVRSITDNTSAMYRVSNTTVTDVGLDADHTSTVDNAGTYNFYYDTDQFKLQNKVGDDKSLSVAFWVLPT